MKRPLVFAHRGDSKHFPENSLLAIEQAIKKGADGLELDLWQCGSGEIILSHDAETQRMCGQPGYIPKMSLSEIRRLSLPGGEKIPTLEESLDLIGDQAWINFEIKGRAWHSPSLEKRILATLEKRNMLHRIILSSFNPLSLIRLKRFGKNVPIGLIFKEDSAFFLKWAWAAYLLKPQSLHPSVACLSGRAARGAQGRGQKVIAWTINNIHDLEACVSLGVHGMITDDPGWLVETLKRKGSDAPILGR